MVENECSTSSRKIVEQQDKTWHMLEGNFAHGCAPDTLHNVKIFVFQVTEKAISFLCVLARKARHSFQKTLNSSLLSIKRVE